MGKCGAPKKYTPFPGGKDAALYIRQGCLMLRTNAPIYPGKNLTNSAVVIVLSRYLNVPGCLISVAASIKPVIAARYSDEAKLMRLTPAAISSGTLNDLPRIATMKFTGLETAAQTCRTAARSGSAGANSTSAPARSYAINR